MSAATTIAQMHPEQTASLAGQFGTPLYLYDGNKLEQQYRLLKDCVPAGFEVFYAVKANPLLGVLQLFKNIGSGAEVASEGELYLALKAGFQPNDIIYTCPGKTPEGIEMALRNNIGSINIESVYEAELINEIAVREQRQEVPVCVRINPGFSVAGAGLQMSGQSTQFGIDEDALEDFFIQLRTKFTRLNLIGVHVYSGTQVMNAEAILSNADRIISLALSLSVNYEFTLKLIDLGGGFGVAYKSEQGLDLHVLREGYTQLWKKYGASLKDVRIIIESGRFLTAAAGEFITRVLSVKVSKGTKYIICDGGYSHHPASFHIGRYSSNRFPVLPVTNNYGEQELVTVTGPTGTPVDILARDIMMSAVAPGDLLRIPNSGAYGFTNSSQHFFSGPSPAEVMRYNGNVYILRKRGNLKTLLAGVEKLPLNGPA
jgi:diaminopimelate decarboxylase